MAEYTEKKLCTGPISGVYLAKFEEYKAEHGFETQQEAVSSIVRNFLDNRIAYTVPADYQSKVDSYLTVIGALAVLGHNEDMERYKRILSDFQVPEPLRTAAGFLDQHREHIDAFARYLHDSYGIELSRQGSEPKKGLEALFEEAPTETIQGLDETELKVYEFVRDKGPIDAKGLSEVVIPGLQRALGSVVFSIMQKLMDLHYVRNETVVRDGVKMPVYSVM